MSRISDSVLERIPRENWAEFLNAFSQSHRGWLSRVEAGGPELREARGMGLLADETPFCGATLERAGLGERVTVTLGHPPRNDMRVTIDNPRSLAFEKSDNGAHRGLRIEGDAGEHVRLRFRAEAVPEALDGLAETERGGGG